MTIDWMLIGFFVFIAILNIGEYAENKKSEQRYKQYQSVEKSSDTHKSDGLYYIYDGK